MCDGIAFAGDILEFPDWEETYRAVSCLKKMEDRTTWLLEERRGTRRYILKAAKGEQADLLETEYQILKGPASQKGWAEAGILEFRRTPETGYLLREYVPGRTLEELAEREGPLEPEEAARLGEKLCRKTGALHRQDPPVIHRDIKPENLVLTETGGVCLIDFGTVRQFKPEQSADTVCMGTRGYAAPEQFGFGQTDARTDIYAIGKVLLYLTTGGCEEEDFRRLQRRRERALGRIIRRCCAYDPSGRYPDTEALERALDRFLASCGKNSRRVRILAALLGVLCVINIWLAGQNLALRKDLKEISPGREMPQVQGISWDPYRYEPDVAHILELLEEENYEEMAKACEELIRGLSENEVIDGVETVACWELSGEELKAYGLSRTGYEYIADRLSYGDHLAKRALGNYGAYREALARSIRTCLEYAWVNEDGSQGRSVLYAYWAEGDTRNMDGCLIDLADCIGRGLEQGGAE